MALTGAEHPSIAEPSRQFWENKLANSRILLADVNGRIHKLELEECEQKAAVNQRTDLAPKPFLVTATLTSPSSSTPLTPSRYTNGLPPPARAFLV